MNSWRLYRKDERVSDKIAEELKEFSFQRLTKPKTNPKVFSKDRAKVEFALVVVAIVQLLLGLGVGFWLGRL